MFSVFRTMNKFLHLMQFEIRKFRFLAHPNAKGRQQDAGDMTLRAGRNKGEGDGR